MDFKEIFDNLIFEGFIYLYQKTFNKLSFTVDLKEDYISNYMYFDIILRINGNETRNITKKFERKDKFQYIEKINNQLKIFYNKINHITNNNKLFYFHQCNKCGKIFKSPSSKINLIFCDECNCKTNNNNNYQVVYFFQSESTGLIKIGTSGNYEQRKRSLELSQGCKIRNLGIIKGDSTLERDLHFKFINFRKIGEWFDSSEDILLYIKNNCEEIQDRP